MSWLSLKIFNALLWLLLEPEAKIFLAELFVSLMAFAVALLLIGHFYREQE